MSARSFWRLLRRRVSSEVEIKDTPQRHREHGDRREKAKSFGFGKPG